MKTLEIYSSGQYLEDINCLIKTFGSSLSLTIREDESMTEIVLKNDGVELMSVNGFSEQEVLQLLTRYLMSEGVSKIINDIENNKTL